MANAAVAEAAPVFAALGDETRLRLLARLGDGRPLSISALAAGEPMTRQAVTRHLRVLETAGLVRGEKSGREQRWELQSARLEDAKDWLETLSRRWDERLDRLRAFVEED
jgi:DNA-binding transcriptional ArsR family regulator